MVDLVVLHQKHPQAVQTLAQEGLRHQLVRPARGGGGLHQFDQGVHQVGLADGFGEEALNAERGRRHADLGAAVGGDHHHLGGVGHLQGLEPAHGFEAVHVRELPVEQDQIDGLAGGRRLFDPLQGLPATAAGGQPDG